MIVVGTCIYLSYSFFNTRINSYDGLNVHLKYILQIAEKGYVNSTEYPIKPYLGEIILSKIYTLLGLRALNLTFGLLTIANIYLANKVLESISYKKEKTKKLALWIFLCSPTFLGMAFQELKVDLIATALVFCIFLVLFKFYSQKDPKLFLLITALTGITTITKTSTIPLNMAIMGSGIFLLWKNKGIGFSKKMMFLTIGGGIFSTILLFWIITFGGTLPQLENHINIYPTTRVFINQRSLTRDTILLEKCNEDKLRKDYASFVYGSRSVLTFLQPLFYLTKYKAYSFSAQGMANPGITSYFGLIILPIFLVFNRKEKISKIQKLILIVTFLTTLIFYIKVGSIFWYLLPLYPIYAWVTAEFIEKISNRKVKKIGTTIIYATLATDFTIAIIIATSIFSNLEKLDGENIRKTHLKEIYEMNMKLGIIKKDTLILDASEHGHAILTTFVPRGDEIIIKSNYYFATANKPLEKMREELLENNIHYIIVNKNKLKDPWYQGCPGENNEILDNFIEKYTKPMFPKDSKYKDLFFEIT